MLQNNDYYMLRFSLGGPDTLRGFHQNRFRGESFYLSQTELRYTPFLFLTLVGFVDLGVAGDQPFSAGPRYSFGGGLRIGLPPDYRHKVRIEWGEGEDQQNFIVTMFHPF